MGKHVIEAADGPGFLVNRCNRPFSLEALRIVQERLATPEQVDRICRLACGFRMGPFELMDLVGIDVGYAIARSFYEQSRRAALAAVAARRAAGGERPARAQVRRGLVRRTRRAGPPDPPAPEPGGGDGVVVVAGESELAAWLLDAADRGRLGGAARRGRPRATCRR